ncbi:ParB N-terminal domain-containing protein [Caballeronia sp. LZ001]|uniref:ParB/RepB/Spo0J family partition protein n=1 Tax=Caballeronia sp. LZ001 TaxID=3038553 RepID=UPI00286353C9|nr:ParB N-terminal domain-containing protein [Caballeronia sp. LZ001]MDR5801621.1 ParB N-terminal domain-containing protein [Caballeronia sp. LZ001]
MAKNSIDAYGASGKTNLLFFDPDKLVLVTDTASPLYDPRVDLPVNEDLARNIDFQGVLQPISVMKNTETGETEVAVGRQRVKAARLANEWRRARGEPPLQIPGQVHRGERRTALTAIISENELRKADTPLGRAEKMRRVMAFGYSETELATIFGCSAATVRATLALLECCADVRKAIESARINVTHARHLSKLPPAQQREKVRELVAAGANVAGHARARAQREALGERTPRMRSRKEILKELGASSGERAEALRWVLQTAKQEDGE